MTKQALVGTLIVFVAASAFQPAAVAHAKAPERPSAHRAVHELLDSIRALPTPASAHPASHSNRPMSGPATTLRAATPARAHERPAPRGFLERHAPAVHRHLVVRSALQAIESGHVNALTSAFDRLTAIDAVDVSSSRRDVVRAAQEHALSLIAANDLIAAAPFFDWIVAHCARNDGATDPYILTLRYVDKLLDLTSPPSPGGEAAGYARDIRRIGLVHHLLQRYEEALDTSTVDSPERVFFEKAFPYGHAEAIRGRITQSVRTATRNAFHAATREGRLALANHDETGARIHFDRARALLRPATHPEDWAREAVATAPDDPVSADAWANLIEQTIANTNALP